MGAAGGGGGGGAPVGAGAVARGGGGGGTCNVSDFGASCLVCDSEEVFAASGSSLAEHRVTVF